MRITHALAASLLAIGLSAAMTAPAQAKVRDSDRDGMPDAWESAHHLNPRVKSDAKADPDGDRLTNLLEYRFGGDPRKQDTDNDGQDDGDEGLTRTKVNRADSDGDKILDGDEDFDRDGVANEDEDDAAESCAADDADTDKDNVADEDENDLKLNARDADSDHDGTADGDEDTDANGVANEDEDDSATDRCTHDTDGDGEADEDETDVAGTITSFDAGTGTLVVAPLSGPPLTVTVTSGTKLRWKSSGKGGKSADPGTEDLIAGAQIAEIELETEDSETTVEKLKLYKPIAK
jgi:hypothetical protein